MGKTYRLLKKYDEKKVFVLKFPYTISRQRILMKSLSQNKFSKLNLHKKEIYIKMRANNVSECVMR